MKEIKELKLPNQESTPKQETIVKAESFIKFNVNGERFELRRPITPEFLETDISDLLKKTDFVKQLVVVGDIDKLVKSKPLIVTKIVDKIYKELGSESKVEGNTIITQDGVIKLKVPTQEQIVAYETFTRKNPDDVVKLTMQFILDITEVGRELYVKYPACIYLALALYKEIAGAEIELDFLD